MASISILSNGRKTIQFVAGDGKRRSVRLGKVSKRQAESTKVHVERLVAASITGHPPDKTTLDWVNELDKIMADRFAAVGLIAQPESSLLGLFLHQYIESRKIEVKEGTVKKWLTSKRYLIEFFGANKNLRDVSDGDADEWRFHLLRMGMAETHRLWR